MTMLCVFSFSSTTLYLLDKTIELQLKIQIQLVSKIFCPTNIFCAQGI
jgi:hypothetical protein